jgi:hypothetical protein
VLPLVVVDGWVWVQIGYNKHISIQAECLTPDELFVKTPWASLPVPLFPSRTVKG